jgi:hypothetical protein
MGPRPLQFLDAEYPVFVDVDVVYRVRETRAIDDNREHKVDRIAVIDRF